MEIETEKFIISEFETQRKKSFETNAPKDDFKIISNIANDLKINFLDALNIIEKNKNIGASSHYKKSLPTG